MKQFEVWLEGFHATGQQAEASFLGENDQHNDIYISAAKDTLGRHFGQKTTTGRS